jgi:hypothetical protein
MSENSYPKQIWKRALCHLICLAFLVPFFVACSVAEQTPGDVSQKFEEGIKGNGKIAPTDNGQSQTSPSDNSPVTGPAGTPPQP